MHRYILSALLILVLALLFGCSTRESESEAALLLLKTADNPFFKEIEAGVREEWAKSPDNPILHVRAGINEGDLSTQRQVLDDFFARYVEHRERPRLKAVMVTPSASGNELADQFRRFRAAKVPVILIDTKISGTDYDVFLGSSNVEGGNQAANVLIEKLPGGGQVLLLNGVDGQETAAARREGFKAAMKRLPNAQAYAITERTCNWRRDEARSTVDSLLALGTKFDGVFAANDEMALGVVEAYRQHPSAHKPVAIIGFDATEEARNAVRAGVLTATIAQDPYGMGVGAVRAAVSIWASQPVIRDQTISVMPVRTPE